ncbi:MAG: Vms1/Ankzf1 family peptidyl-tRNA hydrolase [Ilumatobacteraceae bacterium]|nr:Vms1/Ankzf1 family peptidyl-tRNA hydrolase [Ilumatobacteraceae bacterium]
MSASLDDLQPLTDAEGPFLTLLLPAPSRHADAAERFAVRCKNALKDVSDDWPSDDLARFEQELAALPHNAGASVIVVHATGGPTHVEFIDDAVEPRVFEGPLPRLAPLIESRQRTVAHVVVDADKAGASLTALDGGRLLDSEIVEGDTEHIHRGHPGGWSQRRFQQRAENTWDENADDIAEAADELARRVDARLVAVAGPARARSMVVESIEGLVNNREYSVESIEQGDVDGIADAVTRLTADVAASDAVAAIERAKQSMATADDFDGDVLAALEAGRVDTLLVHDDADTTSNDRLIDRCISRALATGADIVVVPSVAVLDDGVAVVLRW